MKALFLIPLLAALFAMILAAALALYPRTRSAALSAAAILLPATLLMFTLEHYQGLGSLSLLYPVLLAVSGYVIYRRKAFLKQVLPDFLAFVGAFLLALSWRWMLPNLNGSTELLTNLSFIVSHLQGNTLPGNDMWLAGYRLDMYYTFQHYCAALIGRIFGLSPAHTYHIGFAMIYGLIGLTCWSAMRFWSENHFYSKLLIMAALLLGGTGVAPITSMLFEPPTGQSADANLMISRLWSNVRFSGVYEKSINSSLGEKLFPVAEREAHSDSPLETLGYFLHIGDYHATLGSFLLIALLFLIVSSWINRVDDSQDASGNSGNSGNSGSKSSKNNSAENTTAKGAAAGAVLAHTESATAEHQYASTAMLASALLGTFFVLPFAVNGWTTPLFLLYAALTAVVFHRKINWKALLAGMVLTYMLLQPFFVYFLSHAHRDVIIQLTPENLKNPVKMMALQAWPCLLALLLTLFSGRGEKHRKSLLILAATVFSLIIFFDYFGFARDGHFDRFNTAIKVWSWAYFAGILLSGCVLLLQRNPLWLRITGVVIFLAVSSHVVDLYRFVHVMSRDHWGHLSGTAWMGKESPKQQLTRYLTAQPYGTALESEPMAVYSHYSAIPLLAGKQSYLAWGSHEILWRKDPNTVNRKAEEVRAFYAGTLGNKKQWLRENSIDYILLTDYSPMDRAVFDLINSEISGSYRWVAFSGDPLVGLWVRAGE